MSDRSPENGREIEIPEHVAEEIERRLPGTRFETVDDYAAEALELLVRAVQHREDEDPEPPDGAAGSGLDDESTRERLRALGYIDSD